MTALAESVTGVARDYYNSDDADHFYFEVWGGEDIHIGLYGDGDRDIFAASRRTVERLLSLADLEDGLEVLDIGSGYGGAARFIAKKFDCSVTCLNLSEVQNSRNRSLNEARDLADQISVYDGAFESMPFATGAFDRVWCQDALLHSGDKPAVFREVHRVLKPGGLFIFTDPMEADEVSPGALEHVLRRIHLKAMGSFRRYDEIASETGLMRIGVDDMSAHLIRHYAAVRETLDSKWNDLIRQGVSLDYLTRMREGLGHWVAAGEAGHLKWGILRYRKSS